VKWPNDIIGHSRFLQQNRRLADVDDVANTIPFLMKSGHGPVWQARNSWEATDRLIP
jgi:hypothetical protein